jgi:DNA-binding LacI/PurR family transcriptional regulator
MVGFDDIESAAYRPRGLTTVRQPLAEMGEIAAQSVLRRIAKPDPQAKAERNVVAPVLVVRETSGRIASAGERRVLSRAAR